MANLISNYFRKRAEKKAAIAAVPADVRNNEVIKDAILDDRSKKHWKFIRRFLLGSTILAIGIQFTPNLVSTPFSDHMAEKGYPVKLKDHFTTPSIRVYDRTNILYPFHFAGMTTRIEWGDPNDKVFFDYMRSYSPYDNVTNKAYPAMLVTTSLNDSQVMYFEPAKWVAKLRHRKTDQRPLHLKCNMGAGHGGASGRYDRLKEITFEYAWLLSQIGITR